jgi:hypothetical protein
VYCNTERTEDNTALLETSTLPYEKMKFLEYQQYSVAHERFVSQFSSPQHTDCRSLSLSTSSSAKHSILHLKLRYFGSMTVCLLPVHNSNTVPTTKTVFVKVFWVTTPAVWQTVN